LALSVIAAGALGDRKICARDALYLSRFRRINNRAAASPFLLE